jgi:hypothetical protein
MKLIGSPTGTLKIRGPLPSDRDFQATALARDTTISSGGTSLRVNKDTSWTDHTAATVDKEFDVQLTESVAGTMDDMVVQNVTPGVVSYDATTNRATRVADGTAQINFHTAWVSRGVKFAVSRQGGTTSSVFNGFQPGSLAKHICDSIDAKLTGTPSVRKPQYLGDPAVFGHFTRNPDRWTLGWDLSCLSVWNSYADEGKPDVATGNMMGGTLISPKHVLFNAHYVPVVPGNRDLWFVAEDGEVMKATAVATALWIDPTVADIAVLTLQNPLPSKFKPAKVLPLNFQNYLPFSVADANGTDITPRIPVLTANQDKQIGVSELYAHYPAQRTAVSLIVPAGTPRSSFVTYLRNHDSSHPGFTVVNGDVVVLGGWQYGGAGTFCNLNNSTNRSAINTAIAPYSLTEVDLSAFPTY